MIRLAAAAAVLLLAAAARAADPGDLSSGYEGPSPADQRPERCVEFPGLGCYYAPPAAPGDAPLLIYLRGHHPVYKGSVPPAECLNSARQAFAAYELGGVADAARVPLLVTCSSSLGVEPKDLAALETLAGRRFPRRVLAAHSGGYAGLTKTLDAGLDGERILMLDDFYDDDESLALRVRRLVSGGAACAGYFTAHNKKRYEDYFKPVVPCAVDDLGSNDSHNTGVARCLPSYLKGERCP